MSYRLNGFQKLLLVTCVATFGLIVLGGVVRTTGSGLGCPDWPRCHGQLVPKLESDVLIEYSHRFAAMIVGFLILGCAITAWKWYRHHPTVFVPANISIVLLLAQVLLGGATVNSELSGELVAAHLAVAMTLFATLLVTLVASFFLTDAARPFGTSSLFPAIALLSALSVFALILSGSYVAGSNAGIAFDDWPLFDGNLLPPGERLAVIHFLHRLVAALVGLLIIGLFLYAWREQKRPNIITTLASVAAALLAAQVIVGAANVWAGLPAALAVLHLTLAAALWATLVILTASAYYIPESSAIPELARQT